MKTINKIIITFCIFMVAILCYGSVSYGAHTSNKKWLGLYEKENGRPTGFYTSETTTGVNRSIPVIKIVEYTTESGTVQKAIQPEIYCIKDGIGFGSPDEYGGTTNKIVNYSEHFNLKDPDNTENPITGKYRDVLPSGSNYNKLIWLLDNICLINDNDSINELLAKAGLTKADFTTDRTTGSNNGMTDEEFKDIIEMIQQAAIWYFTNAGDNFQPSYNSTFMVATTKGGTGVSLGSKYNLDLVDDPIRMLYQYLIDGANANGSYRSVLEGANAITFDKDRAKVSFENGKILVGPYKVIGNLSNYTMNAKILNGTSELTNAVLVSSDKTTVISGSNTTEKIKANLNRDFYILLEPNTSITKIGINIQADYQTTSMTYWSTVDSLVQSSQPVVIIERTNNPQEVSDEKTITKPIFDVALRKYITAVNGTDIEEANSREPVVDVSPLKTGSTTAKYSHIKEPIRVSENNIITYTIKVYNEGEIDGYVDEIVDHLPPELEFLPEDSINQQYKWQVDTSDTTGRTIKTAYLSKENGETANLLTKFNKSGTALNSKFVQVRCKVKEGAEAEKLITNIAEITRSSNEFGYADRDNTDRVNMPSDSNLPSYKGKDTNKEELNDRNYYYQGQEDDDDFEKIIIEKEEFFDLALRKFIIRVGNTFNLMDDIFNTVDGVSSRTYDREPVITSANLEALKNGTGDLFDGTTTRKKHTKVPAIVNTGDTVEYIIRIYNEGNVDGYADEITDYLPEGLELVPASESSTNRTYGWTSDSTGRIIKTNYLSKTGDRENNLIKAFEENRIWYKDVKVECKVVATPTQTEKRLKNVAEITASSNEKNLADRDSTPNNLTDSQKNSYNPGTSEAGKGYQDDDDYEDLRLAGTYFDVSLRKFITGINNTELKTNDKYDREPEVDVTPLKNGNTTATYKHTKEPLKVSENNTITYTIRVYNEGEVSGYVDEITDHLPPELEFLPNDELNKNYGWTVDDSGRTVKTAFLSKEYEDSEKAKGNNVDNLLKGFDITKDSLDYRDVQIKCKVKSNAQTKKYFTNIAEITKSSNEYAIADRDNTVAVNLPNDINLPSYKGKETNKSELNDSDYYYEGQEDDDDFEKIFIEKFDLALRKFIIAKNGTNIRAQGTETSDGINQRIYDREPVISQSNLEALANGSGNLFDGTTTKKTHTKSPIEVNTGDKVTYIIRVYNEGDVAGYADEITDYLPEGLELIPASESTINTTYGWTASGRIIKTNYLSKEKNATDNLIKAFSKTKQNGMYTISYKDVQIECRVVAKVGQENKNFKNVAEITKTSNETNTPDRDSNPNDLTNNQKDDYKPGTSEEGKGYEDDDDYEELVLPGKYFDLSLRKFITSITTKQGNETKTIEVKDRIPSVDVSPLKGDGNTAKYNHKKEPISVSTNDIVTYTIRIYNEGQVDGYASEIVDHLPPELEFIKDDEVNKNYMWDVSEDGRTVTTTYLSKERNANNILKAFDNSKNTLDYKELQIKCKVKKDKINSKPITNIAEITKSDNEYDIPDRDNKDKVNLPTDENLPNYKGKDSNKSDLSDEEYHYEGQEDDDDFEKLVIEEFDLALRKFITGVNDEEIKDRIPEIDKSKFGTIVDGKEVRTLTYNHTKEPVRVAQNDTVIYTIRVYNEGTKAGYAAEIKDDIPDGLEFIIDNDVNKTYRWVMFDKDGNVTEDVKLAKTIRTDYLSKAQEKNPNDNLLNPFDYEGDKDPDYRDVKVAFKVLEPNTSDRIIINHAEISKDTDKDGNDVDDIDSTPDEWKEGEDDQDIEKIYVKYFDLALRKWVSQAIIIEDGVQKEMDTGHYAEQEPEPAVKVELNKKKIANTIVKFRYQIRITNEGEIEGYATEISDYIPDGLKFNQADNPKWKEVNGKITTDQLKDTLLKPGESATVEVVLTWINGEDNMGTKVNVAEISEDKNDWGAPDIDSTPDNKKEGEDDIDDAPVVLTVITGSYPKYIAIISAGLAIVGAGIFIIKKYVL